MSTRDDCSSSRSGSSWSGGDSGSDCTVWGGRKREDGGALHWHATSRLRLSSALSCSCIVPSGLFLACDFLFFLAQSLLGVDSLLLDSQEFVRLRLLATSACGFALRHTRQMGCTLGISSCQLRGQEARVHLEIVCTCNGQAALV